MKRTPRPYILLLTQGHAGDRLGARLAPALQAALPNHALLGLGGLEMRTAGVQLVARTDRLSAMGWTGVLPKLPAVLASIARAARITRRHLPEAVLAVDTWQPLKVLHRFAPHLIPVPHVCYLPPGPNFIAHTRVHAAAAGLFRSILTPFPHQERLFQAAGGSVRPAAHAGMEAMLAKHTARSTESREPLLALLPGSRALEVRYGLPVQMAAAAEVCRRHPEVRPVVCCADEVVAAFVARQYPAVERSMDAHATMAAARFGILCSGTAVLEAALLGCPGVVTYHVSPLQRWEWLRFHVPSLTRLRAAGIASPYIALPNIIAGAALYPELLGADADTVAAAALEGLALEPDAVRASLDQIRHSLAWNDAGAAVAAAVRDSLTAA